MTETAAEPVFDLDTPPAPAAPRPRVWTVFTAIPAVLLVITALQVGVIAAYAAYYFHQGGDKGQFPQAIQDFITDPWGFLLLAAVSQVAFLAVAVAAAWFSPVPFRERLGLVRPAVPWWGVPVLAVGSLVPLAAGIGTATWVESLSAPDASVAQMYEKMTHEAAVPFLLFIAFGPGIAEELFFRGYVQRRLLRRWRPAVGVGVTSVIFAVFHVTPVAVSAVVPLAFWLGIVGWRTGSVWPGVACHAFVNGAWNVYQLGVRFDLIPEQPPTPWIIAGAAVTLAVFVAATWLLVRARPGNERGPIE